MIFSNSLPITLSREIGRKLKGSVSDLLGLGMNTNLVSLESFGKYLEAIVALWISMIISKIFSGRFFIWDIRMLSIPGVLSLVDFIIEFNSDIVIFLRRG